MKTGVYERGISRAGTVLITASLLAIPSGTAAAQSLGGSSRSLDRQNRQAVAHDFTYLQSTSQVQRFVSGGYLVRVQPNTDFRLKGVSFPYARPEVQLFIERLASQYRSACGERLVVTSLTRPSSRQPRNASSRSVHPTGMALDLRRSNNRNCRAWLERVLLDLERKGVLEATRERRPPHYHIAVFPTPYSSYVERLVAADVGGDRSHRVRRGESLWTIARQYGASVSRLRAANDLRSDRIYAGQTLKVPVAR
jgi:nucleoid-associated protein YgaU